MFKVSTALKQDEIPASLRKKVTLSSLFWAEQTHCFPVIENAVNYCHKVLTLTFPMN